jgi:hypothetical protein
MIKVGLLGDSIRQIGYGPLVPSLLGKDYEVFQPDDNCRFASYLLRACFDYRDQLKDCDIIQFNAGLWDVSDLFGDGPFTKPEVYKDTILRIARLLLKITPNVIFLTTTPVPKENPYDTVGRIAEYNALVVPTLQKMGVRINDLHALILQDMEGNIRKEDLIHLTPKGAALAAEQIVDVIRSYKILSNKKEQSQSVSKTGAPV